MNVVRRKPGEQLCPRGLMFGQATLASGKPRPRKDRHGKKRNERIKTRKRVEQLIDRQHMAHEVVRIERMLKAKGHQPEAATAEAKRLVAKAYEQDHVRTVGNALKEFRQQAEEMQEGYLVILRARGRI